MDADQLDSELQALRERGASVIEAIALMKREQGMPVNAAKAALYSHPAWVDAAAAAEALHDAAEDAALQLTRRADSPTGRSRP